MRESYIQIRVSKSERENIRKNAKLLNLSVTSYLRLLNAQFNLKQDNIDPREKDKENDSLEKRNR